MENPFEIILDRLDVMQKQINRVESLLLELKNDNDKNDKNRNGIAMAMEVTGYAKGTIYNLVNQRLIPHSKKRGKIRFDREALEQWWINEGKRMTINETKNAA